MGQTRSQGGNDRIGVKPVIPDHGLKHGPPLPCPDHHPFLEPFEQFRRAGRGIAGKKPLALGLEDPDHGFGHGRPRRPLGHFGHQIGARAGWRGGRARVGQVHVFGDVPPDDIGGKGALHPGVDHADGHGPGPHGFQKGAQTVHVEGVDQARAPGFEHHGKIARAGHGGQELSRPKPRDPKGLALAEAVAGQKQRPAGGLAKGRAENARALQPLPQQGGRVLRRHGRQHRLGIDLPGQGHGHAIVAGVDRGGFAEPDGQRGFQGQGQGRGHGQPQGRVQDHLAAGRAAGAGGRHLDHQMAGMGQAGPGDGLLAAQILEQPRGRLGIEAVGLRQFTREIRVRQPGVGLFQKPGEQAGKVPVAAMGIAQPKGRGHAGGRGGRDEHVGVGDALDAPVLRAKGKNLPQSRLPDKDLVQFAQARSAVLAAQRVIAPVGNDPARGIQPQQRALAGGDRAVHAVDGEQRRDFANTRRAVAAGQHAKRQVKGRARQVAIRPSPAHGVKKRVHRPGFHPAHGHKDLGQDVQGGAHRMHGFDVPRPGRPGHDRRFQEFLFGGRRENGPAGLAHPVAAAADALHGGTDRRRRAHEHHLVHRANVDAEFQGAGGHHGPQLPGLEAGFHGMAQLAGKRSVVGVGQGFRLVVPIINKPGQLFAQLAAVDENQSGAARPDAVAEFFGQSPNHAAGLFTLGPGDGQHLRLDGLLLRARHHGHGPGETLPGRIRGGGEPADHGRHGGKRRHRGRQGHPLELAGQKRQPFHGGQQKHAALGAGHGMNFVQNAQPHLAEHPPAAPRTEEQIQGLGRGDEDFRRMAQHAPARLGRGVAAARFHPDGRQRGACGLEGPAQSS